MNLKQRITAHYRQNTLQRTQSLVNKRRHSHTDKKESPLRQWLLAADQVDRTNQRILFLTPTTLILLFALWLGLPSLLPLISTPTETTTKHESGTQNRGLPTNKTSTATASSLPSRHFSVQLQLEPNHPETSQILEKIRQRPLPIQIHTLNDKSGTVLLTDETPTTQRDAERLKKIYSQLFGVTGKIVIEPIKP